MAGCVAPEGWGVVAQQLAAPPQTVFALFWHRGEPILPEENPDLARGLRKRIAGKQGQDVGAAFEEALLGAGDDGIGAPVAERGEPQVPIETGLIGGVDARSFVGILRLKAKFVRQPILAVIGALELDL